MIDAIYTPSQNCFGMPVTGRIATTWRALPITGEAVLAMGTAAGVQGIGVSKHRVFADNGTFPGTSVWSPPT